MSGERSQVLKAVLHRLFGSGMDDPRYATTRRRLRSVFPEVSVETFLVALNAISWTVFAIGFGSVLFLGSGLFDPGGVGAHVVDLIGFGPLGEVSSNVFVLALASLAGVGAKRALRLAATGLLAYLSKRRRIRIERTLPGAVRYLHVIAAGSADPEILFESVAAKTAIHGATAESFERVLRIAALSGSVEAGIRRVARDTPSSDMLAPFLLTFLERNREGPEAVRDFLRVESRLLARADERDHRRETRYLRTVVRAFVLLLVVPVVLVLGAVGVSIAAPDLLGQGPIPEFPEFGSTLATAGAVGILALGGVASLLVRQVRPIGYRWAAPSPASSPRDILKHSLINPTNTLLLLGPVVLAAMGWVAWNGHPPSRVLLYGYVSLAIPVGLVDRRRAERRAAIDRRLPAFVHALAQRLDRGLPFRRAVSDIVRAEDFGPLHPHVLALRYDLEVGLPDDGVRKRALERFVGRIGTALAGRTIGLAVGALEAGADVRAAFAALGTETGRLRHADQARRSRFPIVIAVGWTVALLIVAIVVTMDLMMLETATPTSTGPVQGVIVETSVPTVEGHRPQFYLLTQATMVASGWFAGVAGRGLYEGLLHSGALVAVTFLVFRVTGLI